MTSTLPGTTDATDPLGLDVWRTLPVAQQPKWPDHAALQAAAATLSGLPPLVVASEVDQLRERLAAVARGIVQIMVNHIHKENHILFPLVQKFLTKDALREIARRLTSPQGERTT